MKEFFASQRPHEGLTYDEYRAQWEDRQNRSPEPGMDKDERKMLHYLKYNWNRQGQVHDQFEPSQELVETLDAIDQPQLWMVLTEPWCGDSAFLLPVIAEAAERSEAVTLRIVPRDENLDIMDHYLTGGSRSIPKLVAFAEDGSELFTWGPRPERAAELFATLRAQDLPKEEMIQQLLEHYEEGGWRDVDAELADAIATAEPVA